MRTCADIGRINRAPVQLSERHRRRRIIIIGMNRRRELQTANITAETKSPDPYVRRARPTFLYVIIAAMAIPSSSRQPSTPAFTRAWSRCKFPTPTSNYSGSPSSVIPGRGPGKRRRGLIKIHPEGPWAARGCSSCGANIHPSGRRDLSSGGGPDNSPRTRIDRLGFDRQNPTCPRSLD